MRFPPDFINSLRQRVVLSDLIRSFTKIEKKGREYSGLCPFHQEKSPSFTVNDQKGFYHCFGCGSHGSAIDFVMHKTNRPFQEAVIYLAERYGITLPETSPEAEKYFEEQKNLYTCLNQVADWYHGQLFQSQGRQALAYLQERGLTIETIRHFKLGYAPGTRSLCAALKKIGYDETLLKEGGVLVERDDGSFYDRFEHRITFPIIDSHGHTLAFGGRSLGQDQPKYLNSPETIIFHKKETLFGLYHAKDNARKQQKIIVTEGYLDTIALHQHGFVYSVAPLGTALSEEQIVMLWRQANIILLCFDGDSAGQRAVLRAIERSLPFLSPDHQLKIVILPKSEDPDSYVRHHGPKAWQDLLDHAVPLIEFLWHHIQSSHDLRHPDQAASADKKIKTYLELIKNPAIQRHYRHYFSQQLFQASRVTKFSKAPPPWQQNPITGGTPADLNGRWEKALMATLMNHPILLSEIEEELGQMHFSSPQLDQYRQKILLIHTETPLDESSLQPHLFERGWQETINNIMQPSTYSLAPFARPDASLDEAREGLKAVLDYLHRRVNQDKLLIF